MTLILITAPTDDVVAAADVYDHLRVPLTEGSPATLPVDADQIALYTDAAVAAIDGADGWLGRALATQTWELRLDCFPAGDIIQIPLPPLQSVDSVKYLDTDGVEQSVADFTVYGTDGSQPARLNHKFGETWPSTRRETDAVRIRFTAGYSTGEVPDPIQAALLLEIARLYDHRDTFMPSNLRIGDAAASLLAPYRVRW